MKRQSAVEAQLGLAEAFGFFGGMQAARLEPKPAFAAPQISSSSNHSFLGVTTCRFDKGAWTARHQRAVTSSRPSAPGDKLIPVDEPFESLTHSGRLPGLVDATTRYAPTAFLDPCGGGPGRFVVAIGLISQDAPGDRVRLGVDVSRRVDEDDLLAGFGAALAKEVHVRVTGQAVAHSVVRGRVRPARPGCSIAHERGTAGTLGAFVTDNTDVFALSCGHVLAAGRRPRPTDRVLQPGPEDGGRRSDSIAQLSHYPLLQQDFINPHDIALAKLDDPGAAELNLTGEDKPLGPMLDERVSDATPVAKVGRTTGLTNGQVDQTGVVSRLWFGRRRLVFVNQVAVTPAASAFSARGDSGSLVWRAADRRPFGVVVGGGELRSYASPLAPYLGSMGLHLLT